MINQCLSGQKMDKMTNMITRSAQRNQNNQAIVDNSDVGQSNGHQNQVDNGIANVNGNMVAQASAPAVSEPATIMPNTSINQIVAPAVIEPAVIASTVGLAVTDQAMVIPSFSNAQATIEAARSTGAVPRRLFSIASMERPMHNNNNQMMERDDNEERMLMEEIAKQERIRALRLRLNELIVENNSTNVVANPVSVASVSAGALNLSGIPVCEGNSMLSVRTTQPPAVIMSQAPVSSVRVVPSLESSPAVSSICALLPGGLSSVSQQSTETNQNLQRIERLRLDEVRPLLSAFSGDDHYRIEKWLSDMEFIVESLNGNRMDLLRISRQMLNGSAAVYIRNKAFITWDEFRTAMTKEFARRIVPSDVYRQLNARRRMYGESIYRYVLEMQQIGQEATIDEEELIQYILNGLNDHGSDLAILACAHNLDELKANIPRYESRRFARAAANRANGNMSHGNRAVGANNGVGNRYANRAPVNTSNVTRGPTDNRARCYNCSEIGHLSNACVKPRRERGQCFGCGQPGHMIYQCPKRKIAMVTEMGKDNVQPPPTSLQHPFEWSEDIEREDEEALNEQQEVRIDWNANDRNSECSFSANALFDTGSPVNFIRLSKVPSGLVSRLTLSKSPYIALGNEPLFTYGVVRCKLTIRNETKYVNCSVLPDCILPTDILIGRDGLKAFKINLYFAKNRNKNLIQRFHDTFLSFSKNQNKQPKCSAMEKNKNCISSDITNKACIFNLNSIPACIVNNKHPEKHNLLSSVDRISVICKTPFVAACRSILSELPDPNLKINEKRETKNILGVGKSCNLLSEHAYCPWSNEKIEKIAVVSSTNNNKETNKSKAKWLKEKIFDVRQNRIADPCSFSRMHKNDQYRWLSPALPHALERGIEYSEPEVSVVPDIFNINIENETELDIGHEFGIEFVDKCKFIIESAYEKGVRPSVLPEMYKMKMHLTNNMPVYVPPRRLSHHDKEVVNQMVHDLIEAGVVRPSSSEYAAPIVMIKKKSGEQRMCVDYRAINKITLKDNFPLPLIDDCLEFLGNKDCFSILDLKNGFHQLHMDDESIKYTSFVTPSGQYEYVRMPFGLKNGPAVFQRFMTNIFRDMIDAGEIIIYMDDILIATKGPEKNLEILKKLLKRLIEFGLEIKLNKCHFMKSEIEYLGYIADKNGVRPGNAHLRSIANYPQPTNLKSLQACLGLFSYFRRFVPGFSRIAYPLSNLLKKNVKFNFDNECTQAFLELKSILTKSPVLAIYQPDRETELHTDASSHGFGAVLLQKQDDGKFHPVAYYSRKTNEAESKYHSFELESLGVIYGTRRFESLLKGIPFKIITDCEALRLTLSKKNINPKIARLALELENYDYTVVHRKGIKMGHVDALSRHVALINEEEIDFQLQATQSRDPEIKRLREKLENELVDNFKLENGLVFRQINENRLSLYVPKEMENNVMQLIHEKIGHLGVSKCYDQIRCQYWFPLMREKIQKYIGNCVRCIMHSVPPRVQRTMHPIPKKPIPFDTLHIDHYGPLPNIISKKRHILGINDAFTKHVKLYAVNTTSSKEVIAMLSKYFEYFSRPRRIVTDRASCFTCEEFEQFMRENNIEHVKVATASPQANGQIERVNRVLTPMLGKLTEIKSQKDWSRILGQVEYALNNSISSVTKFAPSVLLFGVTQRGPIVDELTEYLDSKCTENQVNLAEVRERASEAIRLSQQKSAERHNSRVAPAKSYQVGDFVVVKHIDTTVGKNKKLIAKYRGPYVVHKVLPHDRYVIKDIENCQITQIPYNGILEAARLKKWVQVNERA